MNRRDFVSRVSLGAAFVCTAEPSPTAARTRAGLTIRFVGMMGFVGRTDGSFLVATPGHGMHANISHQPFLMARAGSPVAEALGLTPASGVVPGAFDMTLSGEAPNAFVYRCLDNVSMDVVGGGRPRVENRATEMADLVRIVPRARVRGNLERWASATIALRGGLLENSAAHPDAGRVWSFGSHQQRLTDAVNYQADSDAELRLTNGHEVRAFAPQPDRHADLWVVSAALPRETSSPTRLEHSHVAFDFLAEAAPIVAECPDARGREVPETELPCVHPTSAGREAVAGGRRFPPFSELCYVAAVVRGWFE